jgi:hypothetical protein
MKNRGRFLAACIATPFALFSLGAGCPRGSNGPNRPCSSTSDCPSGEICHPIGQICIEACNAESECPQNQQNCAPPEAPCGGDAAYASICKCETDALCGIGYVCNLNVDDQCEPHCSSDGDCQGYGSNRKCETTTGKCILETCVDNPSICPNGTTCNMQTRQCQ